MADESVDAITHMLRQIHETQALHNYMLTAITDHLIAIGTRQDEHTRLLQDISRKMGRVADADWRAGDKGPQGKRKLC
jgi:hypothetical protein